jgi:hypothetical protein
MLTTMLFHDSGKDNKKAKLPLAAYKAAIRNMNAHVTN